MNCFSLGKWLVYIATGLLILSLFGILFHASSAWNWLPSLVRCWSITGVCVSVSVAEPVRMNQPVRVTTTVVSDRNIPDAYIPVSASDNQWVEAGGPVSFHVDIKAHQPVTLVTTLRFTHESLYLVTAYVLARGVNQVDGVNVLITKEGGVVKPDFAATPRPTFGRPPTPLP